MANKNVWVSKQGLWKNSKSIKIIASFRVSIYTPMRFETKCKSNFVNGTDHMVTYVMVVSKHGSPEVNAIVVKTVMQKWAKHTHSGNILLAIIVN